MRHRLGASALAAPTASLREQAYIRALAERYSGRADRAARDRTYADAMRQVADRFPDDLDATTLYAESVMDWRLWGYCVALGDSRVQ